MEPLKSCFVISPIGIEGSPVREHADDVFDYIIKPATDRTGYKPTRADHESAPGIITERMYDSILGDDLLIGILTGLNPNVFYEIAVAESAARPLILLIERGQELPFDIKDRRVLFYDLKPRPLFDGTYVDSLVKAITELSSLKVEPSVPFRPTLRPLGSGDSTSRFLERAEELPRTERLGVVRAAESFVWYAGLSLFGFAKMNDFEAEARAAMRRGVEFRILIMDPDNPSLPHQLRNIGPSELAIVKQEIRAGIEFWKEVTSHGPGSVRLQTEGVMYALYQLTDKRLIQTNYSLARSTADSPTFIATSSDHPYRCARADFEWLWARARPV